MFIKRYINCRNKFHQAATIIMIVAMITGCSGSIKTSSGTNSGVLPVAGTDLFLGALTGDTDAAIAATAVGAAADAGQGAYESWRQGKDDKRTREISDAIREANNSGVQKNLGVEGRSREELTRFLGIWSLQGWAQELGGEKIVVTAQVNGNIEMNLYVELAYIDLKATGIDTHVWGNSMLSYDTKSGYSLSTRLNTVAKPIRISGGSFDTTKRTFSFPGDGAKVYIRFETPNRYIVETVLDSGDKVESYTLTRL